MVKKVIKKIIPSRVKKAIKVLVGKEEVIYSANKEYVVNISDSKRFKNKNVIVVGGSGAIGRAISLKFAIEGALVYVGGRTTENVKKVVDEIVSLGYMAKPMIFNVEKDIEIENAFSNIVELDKRNIDILINCAGGGSREKAKYFHEQSVNVIDSIINSNLRGTMMCSRQAAKNMVTNRRGRIINISSAVGIGGMSKYSDYAAAKSGIIGYTTSLALELAPFDINVNCVSPGFIQRGEYNNFTEIALKNKCPMNKIGTLEDVASAVVFMASDESKYITGQNLIVDGGRTLGLYSEY